MPRHTFPLPSDVRIAVQEHVRRAIARISPRRFSQESPYTAALANAIEGIAYDGPNGKVVFTSTVFDDRGPNSAERRTGADLAITAEVERGHQRVRKAILVQSKLGQVEDLDTREKARLHGQIEKMRKLTRSPKVMEVIERDGVREPRVLSGRKVLLGDARQSMSLPRYITARVITTLDGDTRSRFVDAVQDSSAPQLHIVAELNRRRA